MTPALRNPCFSAILCGTALLAPPAPAQSADGAGLLTSTPQSVEDLQRIERQLQQKLPRVLPALVCIELNNGSGSGILVSEKGLVFSAAHVVDKKGTTLKIILPDGTRLPGKTTAQNSNSDAGMAKITSQLNKKLPCVEKAEKMPRVGDWVFALGHGGGLDRKRGPMVRLGRVVSLKNGVIQTDCKLIRGDSGGPLFNLDGKLIGIHSRVGSGLEDNLHVPMKDFDALTEETAEGKTSLTPPPGTGQPAILHSAIMKFPFCVCLSPLVFALFHPALAEGNNGSLDFEQRINGKAVLKTIEPIRERLQDLSAVFFSGHDVVIYGIVLSPDGYIATKASELHSYRDLTIRVGSSKYGQFREIGSDPSTDIAVVKVEAAGLHAPGPVSNDAAMGTLVVSNGSTTRTSRRPQLGTLSAEQRPIPNGDTAYLGVVFGTPCTIQEVTKDGPAAQAGAKAGDEILAVDGTPVTALDAVSPILSRKKVGERVTLKVKRKDKRLSYTITLGSRRQALGGNTPEDSNDLISGGFSKRRDDFPMVLQHDTPSRYTLMGGPLLNLKGELIGMNIARVNRAENYALPISVVQKSVQNILKNTPQPGK